MRGGKLRMGTDVRRTLARYLADTSSSASLEYALLAAGAALASVLGLMQLGGEGRLAARAWLRFRDQGSGIRESNPDP
jgi:Flp pilus assembly pilin Flp